MAGIHAPEVASTAPPDSPHISEPSPSGGSLSEHDLDFSPYRGDEIGLTLNISARYDAPDNASVAKLEVGLEVQEIQNVQSNITGVNTDPNTNVQQLSRAVEEKVSSNSSLEIGSWYGRLSSKLIPGRRRKVWTRSQARQDSETQWAVNWPLPTAMILLGLIGTSGALGHHFYNLHLAGQVVKNADWIQRFGLALAFFTKLCLIGTVEIAYKQRVWVTVKKRSYRMHTIDGLFSACNNPFSFLNHEFLFEASIPALLAALVWLLPLSAIASPASLTSVASVSNTSATCQNVPTLNFSEEIGMSLSSPLNSLCFYAFAPDGTTLYYDSPSTQLTKVATISLVQATGPLAPANPCPGIGNCSYTIQFDGPAYDCQEQPDIGSSANNSMTKSKLIPTGNLSYFGLSSVWENDYGAPSSWFDPNEPPDDVGVFPAEPDLWIGYAINTSVPLEHPTRTPWGAVWKYNYTQHVLQCSLYKATYRFRVNWLNGLMSVDTTAIQLHDSVSGSSPYNSSEYQLLSSYHAAAYLFRAQLSGAINQTNDTIWSALPSSAIAQTRLVDPISLLAIPSFPFAIQAEFTALILSLASDVSLAVRVNISTPCTYTATQLVWNYQPLWLVLSYSFGVAGMLFAVLVGGWAFWTNGYAVNLAFSTVVASTRNADLDHLMKGYCLGVEPAPKRVMRQRLRFGDIGGRVGISDEEGHAHAAFGLEESVRGIEKGKKYI